MWPRRTARSAGCCATTTLYTQLIEHRRRAPTRSSRNLDAGQGIAAKMLTDQALYDQLNKTVTDLNAILADVRRESGQVHEGDWSRCSEHGARGG